MSILTKVFYRELILLIVFIGIVFSQNSDKQFESLKKYVGTYPSNNDFLKNKVVVKGLKSILKKDYSKYHEFLDLAGCGKIEMKDSILVSDNSQEHVGGYSSIILIDMVHQRIYLFWLNSAVEEKDAKIYGERPIPSSVGKIIEDSMNSIWGDVASFKVVDDAVQIKLKDQ